MDNLGADFTETDPFAPLGDDETAGASHAEAAGRPEPETWEPIMPAPGEPPEAGAIWHFKHGEAASRWVYRNHAGLPLFAVARFDTPAGKEMLPYTWGKRSWTLKNGPEAGMRRTLVGWHFKRAAVPVPLYGVDQLAARPHAPVIVCEGEKTADAAAALFPDMVAVTSQGGSKAAQNGDWQPLDGRTVIIWPDNDTPGASYAADVCTLARRAGAASVRRVAVPASWPKGWDLADPVPLGQSPNVLHDLLSGAETITPLSVAADMWDECTIPTRPWIARGYLLRGAVTLVAGPPSALKSSTMLAWASAGALGMPFGRFRPLARFKTAVYNVEDDQTEQKRRLSAVLRGFDASPADIAGRVIRCTPIGLGTLFARDKDGNLGPTAAMEELERLIEREEADVLIVDPFSELHGEEENDNTAIRTVIAKFRSLAVHHKIAVVILHHTRKGSSLSPGDPDVARGASSIIGAVRVALTLSGMSEDDAKGLGLPTDFKSRSNYVRMDDAKSNYAPLREAEWLEKVAYNLDNGDIVAAAVPWSPPAAKIASQTDLMALAKSIERGSPNGEPWSPKLSKDQRSVRALLEQHGFVGKDAQDAVMLRLHGEMSVSIGTFRRSNRAKGQGLRIADQPAADWVEESDAT